MKKILGLATLAVAGLFVFACGSDSNNVISTKHTAIYQGAGSIWTWSLNANGTFSASMKDNTADATNNLEVSGTYEGYSTGFYKFTVSTASSPDGSVTSLPTAGDTAYGFAVPNVILLVKPAGNGSELIPMPVLTTTCPTDAIAFNWVRSDGGSSEGSLLNADLWGNATIPAGGGQLTGKKFILDGTEGTGNYPNANACSEGKFVFSAGADNGFINLTSGGVGIVNVDTNDGDIIALPRDTSVTTDTLRNKSFAALVFDQSGNSGAGDVKPLNVTFPATGDGTYTFITDVETGATGETGPLQIVEAGSGEKAGFLKLTANSASDTNRPTMWAATVANLGGTGRTFFFAAGANVATVGGAANDAFVVIAIQK